MYNINLKATNEQEEGTVSWTWTKTSGYHRVDGMCVCVGYRESSEGQQLFDLYLKVEREGFLSMCLELVLFSR